MRPHLVAGNWKMHGSGVFTREFLADLCAQQKENNLTDLVVFPPSPYLAQAQTLLSDAPIALGAQNVSNEESGAFTGEVSSEMLLDCGCQYVLVGHSERRQLYGETNALVAKKFARAKQSGLIPVLCLGETQAERDRDETFSILAEQLNAIDGSLSGAVLAYEPVWAIGTGLTASPEDAQAVHAFLRKAVAQREDESVADQLPILYGGSVKPQNAAALFACPDIDGGLVGGASLNVNDFVEIAKCNKSS